MQTSPFTACCPKRTGERPREFLIHAEWKNAPIDKTNNKQTATDNQPKDDNKQNNKTTSNYKTSQQYSINHEAN